MPENQHRTYPTTEEEKPQYKRSAYIRHIQMANGKKHLLVEGRSDKKIFKLLIDELRLNEVADKIIVDSAEDLTKEDLIDITGQGDIAENYQKVEKICQSIANKDYKDNLVGFTDRNFRGFDTNGMIKDLIESHQVDGRLVWSRGHSIENYFFHPVLLRKYFRGLLFIEDIQEVLSRFDKFIDSAFCLACVLSLVARDLKTIQDLPKHIEAKFLSIKNSKISIVQDYNSEDAWLNRLKYNNKIDVSKICESYQYWDEIVEKTNGQHPEILRWLCHGHIGVKVIWEFFQWCLNEENKKETGKSLKRLPQFPLEEFPYHVANLWAITIKNQEMNCEYPTIVLRLLDLSLPDFIDRIQ